MARVSFTPALKRYFPQLTSVEVEANTVAEIVERVETAFPGMKSYLTDDTGAVRPHVNIFVGETLSSALTDAVAPTDEIFIMQAISGG